MLSPPEKCLKRLKKVKQYLYCSIFPAHIIRWRHKKYLNHCHRRKKEGSSVKKPLICIKKCLLLFWMRKKFVIIQKQYYPAIADVVPYKLHLFIFLAIAISWRPKKKWGSFYWQSLCNIRVYQKHAKNLVQAMLVLKSPVFSTSTMANPILFDYLFFFEKILLLIRTLYKFTHKLVAIIFCHLWIVCMYKMNLLSTSKKCSNMTLVFLPLKNWHSFFIIFWECMWFIVTWNVANVISIR